MEYFLIRRPFGVELEVSNLGIINNEYFEVKIDYLKRVVSRATKREVVAINDWSQTVDNDYWHVKYDATCGELGKGPSYPRGWEIASFKASGYNDLLHIAAMADALASCGLKVNDHCGLHIHGDISDFEIEQAAVLAARWIKLEQWMKQAVPKSRKANKYCKLLNNKKKYNLDYSYTPNQFWKLFKPTNLSLHENTQKKVTLNFVNYAAYKKYLHSGALYYRPTIELRLPEGTLNSFEIINWVEFFLFFIETSKNALMPMNIIPETNLRIVLDYLGLNISGVEKDVRNWLFGRICKYGQLAYIKKIKEFWSMELEEELDV